MVVYDFVVYIVRVSQKDPILFEMKVYNVEFEII